MSGTSMQQEQRARIGALLPVMEQRYQIVRDCLSRASQGEDLPEWELDLARKDLEGVLAVMSGEDDEGDDDI
ncbi:MAG: hypothetical protein U1E83_01250 [Methylotetracoccus sp.]